MKIVILEGENIGIQEDVEYAALGFDAEKQEYVKVGRSAGNELLCRNRLKEAVEKGLVPKSVDCTEAVIRKRKVVTYFEEG